MDQLTLLYRVMVLLLGHHPKRRADAAFVFGRAQGDFEATDGDSGILEKAAGLYRNDLVAFVIIPSQEAGVAHGGKSVATTFPGTQVFRRNLEELGVPQQAIVVPGDYVPYTRAEGDAYVRLAKERGWTSAVTIQHPHQAPRTMLGLLKSFAACQHHMHVVPDYPWSVNWSKRVYGSQGAQLLPRHEHIQEEWRRILEYQAKGDLASWEELEHYLADHVS
ncbi:MAG: hypothetical protein Q8R32_00465 [bacterium]|nr:hypothetical protein [bacterium]